MTPVDDEDGERPLNYYNYFTEVEEAFVRRRGAHMMVSPMDWALIETWKEVGVPLHIVLRAIEQAFDGYEAKANRFRRVNTIFYCQQEVESCYAEYRRALVGSAETMPAPEGVSSTGESDESPFPRVKVERFLTRVSDDLVGSRERAEKAGLGPLAEAVGRAGERLGEIVASLAASTRLDAEGLERDLTSLEAILLAALEEHAPPEQVEAARAEAKSQLKGYKKGMDKDVYTQTLEKLVARRLREMFYVPRLSLFFMD